MQSGPPRICTVCGQEGHCASDGCSAAAPAAPRPDFAKVQPEAGPKPVSLAQWGRSAPRTIWPARTSKPEAAAAATATGSASSSRDHQGASPAERDDPMPPLIPLPTTENTEPTRRWPAPKYSEAQNRYSVEHGGGLGSEGTPSGRAYVETPAWRHLRERDELEVAQRGWIAEPEAAATEPNPMEAPEMPDAPASAYGIGTYDAFHAGRAEAFAEVKGKIKGKSKGKSKDKSKGKSKGKSYGSRDDPTYSSWTRRDLWRYDGA